MVNIAFPFLLKLKLFEKSNRKKLFILIWIFGILAFLLCWIFLTIIILLAQEAVSLFF
jgi:hypothetical protein